MQNIGRTNSLSKSFKYSPLVSASQSLHHIVKITHKNTEVFVR